MIFHLLISEVISQVNFDIGWKLPWDTEFHWLGLLLRQLLMKLQMSAQMHTIPVLDWIIVSFQQHMVNKGASIKDEVILLLIL